MEVMPEAAQEAKEVRLRVDAVRAQAGLIGELARLVKDFPGETPVYLNVDTSLGPKVLEPARATECSEPRLLRRGQGAARRSRCRLRYSAREARTPRRPADRVWGVNIVVLFVSDWIFDGIEIGRRGPLLLGAAVLGTRRSSSRSSPSSRCR